MKGLNLLGMHVFCAMRRPIRWLLMCLVCSVVWFQVSTSAWALVEGQRPRALQTFKIFGSAISTGNTMMTASPPGNVNDILLPQNSARVDGVPFDGTVKAAYLWWTGSLDGTPDNQVDFTLPDGFKTTVTSPSCQTVPSQGGFFYCRAEITSTVRRLSGLKVNGNYTLAGLRAKPGNCQQNPRICQARYAAWAMVVVWESPTEKVRRDIVLYDGFLHMDEQPSSSGITSFNLSGFKVGNPPKGSLTYFGLEGDRFLGSPPEPSNHADFISFRSSSAASGSRLQSSTPHNPSGNIWNSTIALGVDLDTFNIGQGGLNLIKQGDTQATIVCGTGDGIVPGGNGESVFLGFILFAVDTLTPSFRSKNTYKRVSQQNASVGDTLTYTLRVSNDGSLAAGNTIVQDAIPPNTTYIANSTRLDGTLIPDVGGTSPVVNGLNLGRIDFRGDNDREVTFRVRITGTPPSRRIENSFQVKSDEVGWSQVGKVVTTLRAPQLGAFTKSVQNQSNPGGPVRPGDTLAYTIDGKNAGGVTAGGIQFVDDLPKFVKFVSVFPPGGSTNQSSGTGGANGTGRIDIRNISVLPNSSTRIFFTVRVFTEAEFVAAGVSADKIHNTPILNQGLARHPSLPSDLKTDDPTTPARNDPTVVRVNYRALFAGSTKSVKDENGGRLEPGDTLTYTVKIVNKGTRDTTVTWTDNLPSAVGSFQQISMPTGATPTFQAAPAGANKTGLLTVKNIPLKRGATAQIVFRVKVDSNAVNGLQVTNIGTITDEKDSSNKLQIQSPTLVVVAGPLLDTSTKVVVNAQTGKAVTTVTPGMVLRYTISVKNSGNRPAPNVTVEDTVSALLDQIQPQQGGQRSGSKITWSRTTTPALASIAPNATVTVSFTARVKTTAKDGDRIPNSAKLNAVGLPSPTTTDDPNTPPKNDPTVVVVSSKPRLVLTKVAQSNNGLPAKPGDTLTYTLTLRNVGTGTATNVEISDPIDTHLLNPVPTSGRVTGRAVVWDKTTLPRLASVAVGVSIQLRFTAQIASPLSPQVKQIRNQASVKADGLQSTLSDDPGKPGSQDPTDVPVSSQAQPIFTKTVRDLNGGDVVPGDILQYTITIQGGGNAPILKASVRDTIPAGLQNIQVGQNGLFQGGVVWWKEAQHPPLKQINPGQSVTLTFTAQVAATLPDKTRIANRAILEGNGLSTSVRSDDPSTPAKPDDTVAIVRSRTDLSTSTKRVQDVNGGQLLPGDTVSYTLFIRNTGNVVATGVRVTDKVDANLENVQVGQSGQLSGGTITWNVGTLAKGRSLRLTFTARVKTPLPHGTVIRNQGVITVQNGENTVTDDPSTPKDDDSTNITVTSGPSFADSTKEVVDVNGGQVIPGDQLRYTITVINTGTDVARNVVVTDKIDTVHLNSIAPGQNGRLATGTITWNAQTTPALARIPVGGRVTLSFLASVVRTSPNATVIENQASIQSVRVTTPTLTDDPRTVEDDDSTKVTVVAGAALGESTKAVRDNNRGLPLPGDTLTYTIVVKNTGTGVARDVVVTDKIDTKGLINIQPGQGGLFSQGQITWNAQTTPALSSIAQNGSTTLTFTAQIAPGLLQGTEIANQAFLRARDVTTPVPTDDPSTPQKLDDPTLIVVGGVPDLVVEKTALDGNGGAVEPGDVIRYRVVIRNRGLAAANNVVVSDAIDTNLEQVTPSNGGVFDSQARRILWNLTALQPNASVGLTFTARIKSRLFNGTIIKNQAQVTSSELSTPVVSDDPNTPKKNDSTDLVVSSPQRLEVKKNVRDLNGGGFRPGDTIVYTIQLRNLGRTAVQNLRILDKIDPNLTNILPGQGGQFANGEIRWTVASVDPQSTQTFTFRAQILSSTQDGTTVSNQAVVTDQNQSFTLPSDDPSKPGPEDPTDFVVAFPSMTLTKVARDVNGGTYEKNDVVEYSITVQNTGRTALTDISVSDPVDGNFLEQIIPGQNGQVSGQNITWNAQTTPALARLDAGKSVVLTFRVIIKQTANDGQRIANQATAKTKELTAAKRSDDPDTPQPNDPTIIIVRAAPNLSSLTKEVRDDNGGTVRPGDRLTYTIKVTNSGSVAARRIVVKDQVDTRLTSIQVGQGGRFVNNTITWDATTTPSLSLLAPKASVTLTFTAVIAPNTPDATVLPNQATVVAQNAGREERSDDPRTPAPKDPTRVTVQSASNLTSSTKAVRDVNGGSVQAGDILEYTIRVVNDGSQSASQVRVVDATPQNTEFVSGSVRLNGVVIPDGGTNPLHQGLLVRSARSGTQPGVVIPDDGAEPSNEIATVTFRVRVRAGTPKGTRIANTALISERGIPKASPNVTIVVGGGPQLDNTSKSYRIAVDQQQQGVADVGDVLEYSILIRNSGTADAQNVVFTDAIPENTQYISSSIQFKGQPQTDTGDSDPGQFQSNIGARGTVRVQVGALKVSETVRVTFRVRITGGKVISNQGFVSADAHPREGTDSDNNDANGDQPTLTPVGTNRLLTAIKEVVDVNGDSASPGDVLEYRITVRNSGQEDIADIKVDDVIPTQTTFEKGSAQGPGTLAYDDASRTVTFSSISLSPGATALLIFRVKINNNVASGTVITNIANVKANQVDPFKTQPARITVRKGGGVVTLTGLIFQDFGADDTQYNANEDELLPGFKVRLYAASDLTKVVQSVTSDSQGKYTAPKLPQGRYTARVYTQKDVQFGEWQLNLTKDGTVEQHFVIEPTGRVYNSKSGDTLTDATVYLVYNDNSSAQCRGDKDCATDSVCVQASKAQQGTCFKKVADNDLLENQQGQSTNTLGMYKFSVPSNATRSYVLVVRPAQGSSVFPSQIIRPQTGVAEYVSFADNGKIVAHDKPTLNDSSKATTYYTSFRVTEDGKIIQNNHLPVDVGGSLITLTKTASVSTATIGDIITYTLELKNNSPNAIVFDSIRRVGGLYITDILPKGFSMLPESPRATVNGKLYLARAKMNVRRGQSVHAQRIFKFGPFNVPAEARLVLRYQTVVGRQLPVGEYINVAHAHNPAGGRYTEDAKAMVRVTYDPILDQGTVLGKVFCDKNKNRWQDPGELGVEGVKIFLDSGFYVSTDRYGKYHLQAIDPGNHMLKVDKQTLPPGSKMIDLPDKVFYVSRGLVRKINFAITCTTKTATIQKVYLARGSKVKSRRLGLFSIKGSAYGPKVTINGKSRALPVLNMAVSRAGLLPNFANRSGLDFPLQGRSLKKPILFHVRFAAGFAPSEWRLQIYTHRRGNRTGRLIREIKGVGVPPASIPWDGRSVTRRFLLRAKRLYLARLTMTTHGGAIARSPLRVFGVGYMQRSPRTLWRRTLRADLMGKRRGIRVNRRMKRVLRRIRPFLRGMLRKPRTHLELEVHHDGSKGRTRALFFTVRRASSLRRYLKKLLRMPSLTIRARGLGSSKPLLPNISRRNRRRNRRIVLRVIQKPKPTTARIPTLKYVVSVRLKRKTLRLGKRGSFSKTLHVRPNKNPRLLIRAANGGSVEIPLKEKFSAQSGEPTSRILSPIPKGKRLFPNFDPGVIVRQKRKMMFAFRDGSTTASHQSLSARPMFLLYLSTSSIKRLHRKSARTMRRHNRLRRVAQAKQPPQPAILKAVRTVPPVRRKSRVVPKRTPVRKKVTTKKPKASKDSLKGMKAVPASQAKNVRAAQLVIELPPQGAVIRKERLLVKGITQANNILKINGQAITIRKNGHFRGYVRLKHGQKKLLVRTRDKAGNVGEIVWPVHVNLNRLFLMAFVDTALAQAGAKQLEGFNNHSSFKVGDFIFHGRAVLYAKGQLLGKHFLRKMFKKIRFTAHFDSAKKREVEEFYRQLIDPERYYPIYGDSSTQVQDVVARNKVYVLIEADRSKLVVGNFRTQMRGIELKRYDRTFYGVNIDFKKRFAKHFDTRARFFISDGEQKQLKAHVELRGTGGSLYYLKHRQLLEGSEQVRLTVRDRDSNIVLAQIPLSRNEHYSIQYYDGRIFFKYPIPTAVDSFVLTQHNLHVTMNGHPIFVEVDYEYEAVEGQGGLAIGTRVEQGLWDKVRLGFSFVQEGRKDNPNPYRLWGFDATFEWNKSTYVKAEFARSESFDSQSYLSTDGGLSFQQIQFAFNNLSLDTKDYRGQIRNISGNAVVVKAASDIGQLAKWKKVGLNVLSYFSWREDGFFAAGQTQEQGTMKGGVLANITLYDKHKIRLKYDGARFKRYDIITQRLFDYEQHIANLGYTFRFLPNWDAVLEYSFTSNYDQRAESILGNKALLFGNFVTLGANWRVNKIFHVLLRQQLAFATESRQPLGIMDHFATTLGLGLKVFKGTFVTGSGTVRWSGNTSAQIGLKTELNKNTQVYVREQFNFAQTGTGLSHTLVVGAAKKIAKNSRVYGEYQLDGGYSGTSSRAVVGLGHVFPLFRGFFVGAGFERAQFLDASTGNSSRTVGRITLKLTRFKQIKASGRYEIRYDDNDEKAGLVGDRIQFVTVNNIAWQFTKDLALLARVNYAITHNASLKQGAGGTEGELFEATGGLAFRPVRYDWLQILLKYTHRQEVRPIGLLADSRAQRTQTEVFSLVPIVELPFRLQLVEQVAVRFRKEEVEGLQAASSITFQWINRLNFHLWKRFDIGIEYRLLWMWFGSAGSGLTTPSNQPKNFDHGLLIEAAYNIHRFVHVGVGYNFTSFSDNLLADPTRNYSGFFLRVVGKY